MYICCIERFGKYANTKFVKETNRIMVLGADNCTVVFKYVLHPNNI